MGRISMSEDEITCAAEVWLEKKVNAAIETARAGHDSVQRMYHRDQIPFAVFEQYEKMCESNRFHSISVAYKKARDAIRDGVNLLADT